RPRQGAEPKPQHKDRRAAGPGTGRWATLQQHAVTNTPGTVLITPSSSVMMTGNARGARYRGETTQASRGRHEQAKKGQAEAEGNRPGGQRPVRGDALAPAPPGRGTAAVRAVRRGAGGAAADVLRHR